MASDPYEKERKELEERKIRREQEQKEHDTRVSESMARLEKLAGPIPRSVMEISAAHDLLTALIETFRTKARHYRQSCRPELNSHVISRLLLVAGAHESDADDLERLLHHADDGGWEEARLDIREKQLLNTR